MIAIQSTGPHSGGPEAYFDFAPDVEKWVREQWGEFLISVNWEGETVTARVHRNGSTFTNCYRVFSVNAWREKKK